MRKVCPDPPPVEKILNFFFFRMNPSLRMPSKKKFIWKEKFLSGGEGVRKKGPTKFPIKVGKFYQGRGVHYKISFVN